MFGPVNNSSKKDQFLEAAKIARAERAAEKNRETAAVTLQARTRGWLARIHVIREIQDAFDETFPLIAEDSNGEIIKKMKPAMEMYKTARNFLSFCKVSEERERFERLCRYLVTSLGSESPKTSYISVALNKDTALVWISHMKTVLSHCVGRLSQIKLASSSGAKELSIMLSTLISFTSTNTWKLVQGKSMEKLLPGMNNLCANFMGHLVNNVGMMNNIKVLLLHGLATSRILLKKTTISAVMTLVMRPVISASFSDKLVSLLLLHILSVPGLIHHLEALSPDTVVLLQKHQVFQKSITLLSQEQQLRIHFNALEGSYALCLTGNLVHLISISAKSGEDAKSTSSLETLFVLTRLLDSCGQYVTAKQSNLSHWHPVLGWFSVSLDSYLQESMSLVKSQLARLWGPTCIKLFVQPLQDIVNKLPDFTPPPEQAETNSAKQFLKKALEKTKNTTVPNRGNYTKLGSPECMNVAMVCSLYQSALKTLSQLRLEILAGLNYKNMLLDPLWCLIQSFGPQCGLKPFLDHLTVNPKATAPEFQILILFCDCLSHLITILDDVEMYEKQVPFTISNYIVISNFLNTFLFKAIWTGLLIDTKSSLFTSMHSLLMALYRRDCRRQFTKPNHWLARDLKISGFLSDLQKSKKSAVLIIQKLPHVIPHEERVLLFRRKVTSEKSSLGLIDSESASAHSTLITIHRSRIVEDGYRQLSTLSSTGLKGIIRVKFVNVQGLDEAGIDQDGVFKEFLEETIKKVFDPSLNLFCSTTDGRLYPSPVSHMTENHLHLFEFVGKMIGKAVYEGIVIDVPFASFFLSQILGQDHSAFYSYIDELPSLDAELYKNLAFIRHHEGDVADLDLTFSFDQDVMGQIVTHELVPGGRGIIVTNDNKISYLHHVAHFRMHTQIRDQTVAFTRGFRSIINPDWLSLFSPPEVQRLIGGDNSPLDLKDLRRCTHYYGGFHDAHRVVGWLWDILEKDFDDAERGAFLKFVTSCSKPPLLGFENLEPPFSIRCVEVAGGDDDGDTVGSVLRGFLSLRRKDPVNRLPTASTCFNLLKLPNYQKKSTLREKLRYAIKCNTGFELS